MLYLLLFLFSVMVVTTQADDGSKSFESNHSQDHTVTVKLLFSDIVCCVKLYTQL